MYVHLISIEKYLWVAITQEPFIPNNKANNYVKLPKDWIEEETKKASYDLKLRNIIITISSAKVYYSILHHKSAQTM